MGKKAPSFTLKDQDGKIHKLSQYQGGMVLVYFYPKDMTSGCTVEAQGFRDAWKELKKLGVTVLGVSPDSVASHKKFCDKEKLNFPLLADEKREVVNAYGVWVEKSMYGRKYMGVQRDSFLVSKDGKVLKHYEKVKPADHPGEVIADVKSFARS